MTRWAMTFDLDRCIGCWACAVACKVENSVGEGLWWQQVDTVGGTQRDSAAGTFPQLDKHYRPRNCFHCAEPPCLPACPEGSHQPTRRRHRRNRLRGLHRLRRVRSGLSLRCHRPQ